MVCQVFEEILVNLVVWVLLENSELRDTLACLVFPAFLVFQVLVVLMV